MALEYGAVAHLLPQNYERMVSEWLEEDCPSFDFGGFVVGEAPAEARLLGKSTVGLYLLTLQSVLACRGFLYLSAVLASPAQISTSGCSAIIDNLGRLEKVHLAPDTMDTPGKSRDICESQIRHRLQLRLNVDLKNLTGEQ